MYFTCEDREFYDEDELRRFVAENIDESYLEEFLDDMYESYSDNTLELTPSEIHYAVNGSLRDVREDEDLWEWFVDNYFCNFYGFDAEDYEDEEELEVLDWTFTVHYDDEDKDEEEVE